MCVTADRQRLQQRQCTSLRRRCAVICGGKFARHTGLIENQINIQFSDWTARRRGFQDLPLLRRQFIQPLSLCPAFHLPILMPFSVRHYLKYREGNSFSSTCIALALFLKPTGESGKVIGRWPHRLGSPGISKLATHCSDHCRASRELLSAEAHGGNSTDAEAP